MVDRIVATPAALDLIRTLAHKHGTLMFYQSGGCCENSAPNCYLPTDLTIGNHDVLLGTVGGVPYYMSKSHYATWQHTQVTLDVTDCRSESFSLEAPEGKAFLTRSRVFTAEEQAWLDAHPAPEGPAHHT